MIRPSFLLSRPRRVRRRRPAGGLRDTTPAAETLESRQLLTFGFGSPLAPVQIEASPTEDVALADIDNDGDQDLAVGTTFHVQVYRGNGRGEFSLSQRIRNERTGAPSVAFGNVVGSSRPDLISKEYGLRAFDASTSGSFGGWQDIDTGTLGGSTFLTADFNGDGREDALGGEINRITSQPVLRVRTAPNFNVVSTATIDLTGASLDAGDLDGDRDIDVVVATRHTLYTLFNDGRGTFQVRSMATAGRNDVRLADIDGDGDRDVVYAIPDSDQIGLHLNDGRGGLGSVRRYSVNGDSPVGLAVADLNGDGRVDVVTANSGPRNSYSFTSNGGDSVSVLLGTASGGFAAAERFAVGNVNNPEVQPSSVALADVTGDGVLDAVVGHDFNHAGLRKASTIVSVVPGRSQSAQPDIAIFGANPDRSGSYNTIVDGQTDTSRDDSTLFPTLPVDGGSRQHEFVVLNTGPADLLLSSRRVQILGQHSSDFRVVSQPTTTVRQNNAQTFRIEFNPTGSGLRTATVRIDSNDPDESPYTFVLRGEGEQQQPDLRIESAYLSDRSGNRITNPQPGQQVYVRTNFSAADLPAGTAYTIWHRVNGVVRQNRVNWRAGEAGRGGMVHVWGAWTIRPGSNVVEVHVDAGGEITEANESDNHSRFIVNVGSAPTTPTVTGPASRVTNPRPTISWQADSAADRHEVWVANAGTRIAWDTQVTGSSWRVPVALANGEYQVWVRSFNEVGTSAWSNPRTFTVAASLQRPGRLSITSPSTKVHTTRPTFSWTAAPRAEHYQVRVDRVRGPRGVIHQRGLNATSFRALNELRPGRYAVRVRAWNSAGPGKWTKAKFRITANASSDFLGAATGLTAVPRTPVDADALFGSSRWIEDELAF